LALLGLLAEIVAHLLKETYFLVIFGIYLGGRFTRVCLLKCLVDVSEFLQNSSLLNGYGIIYLHFVVIIYWIKP
jgi:hypothetical protein